MHALFDVLWFHVSLVGYNHNHNSCLMPLSTSYIISISARRPAVKISSQCKNQFNLFLHLFIFRAICGRLHPWETDIFSLVAKIGRDTTPFSYIYHSSSDARSHTNIWNLSSRIDTLKFLKTIFESPKKIYCTPESLLSEGIEHGVSCRRCYWCCVVLSAQGGGLNTEQLN